MSMILSLVGQDGAGKSTQTGLITNLLRRRGLSVEVLDKWSVLNHVQNPECRFINTELDDLRECIAEMEGSARSLFLFYSIATSTNVFLRQKDSGTIFIADGYWQKHAASEIVYGCDEDWILSTSRVFPEADMTFYLRVDIELAARRKDVFTSYECGRVFKNNRESFVRHQRKVQAILDSWSIRYGWIVIDAAGEMKDISDKIIASLSNKGKISNGNE